MNVLKEYLPRYITEKIEEFKTINEIKLKRDAAVCIKVGGKNTVLDIRISSADFDVVLDKLLCRSYHSQLSNIVEGYISLGEGYRCGVCGRAVLQNGRITNLSDIISVVIRIPGFVTGISLPITEYLLKTGFTRGVLIYSPPGVGKTTLLRDVAVTLCSKPYYKRIALIDSRKELYIAQMQSYPLIDPYIGYPKGKGIELAIRTMAPDMIICDEIGNEDETRAILDNQSSGVPIIASAHGSDLRALIMRENIGRLYRNAVFGCYAGITRRANSSNFRFEIFEYEGENKIGS